MAIERNRTTKAFYPSQLQNRCYNENMNNEPLHDAIIARIIDLYEGGNDPLDIHDHFGYRVSLDEIKSTLSDYETSDEDFEMEMF